MIDKKVKGSKSKAKARKALGLCIRATAFPLSPCNTWKVDTIDAFITAYRVAAQQVVDYIWTNGFNWIYSSENKETGEVTEIIKTFDIKQNKFELPSMLDSGFINTCLPPGSTILSGRAAKRCANQVVAMLTAATAKQKNRIYKLTSNKEAGMSKTKMKGLIRNIKANIPQKPCATWLNPELDANHVMHTDNDNTNTFDHRVELHSLFNVKNADGSAIRVEVPYKEHKHSKSLAAAGNRVNSIILTHDRVYVRYEVQKQAPRTTGVILGADQGLKTVLSLSNGATTPNQDIHGHSLDSIIDTACRRQQGGKGFKRAKAHQVNFVNWSIKQLNLGAAPIKEIRLEEIRNINKFRNTSSKMKRWQNTIIRDRVMDICERAGVQLALQSSTYRSQRCTCCGLVRKANRKGKIYTCGGRYGCGYIGDADVNAAKNHEVDLTEVPKILRDRQLNRGDGFYWKSSGFYDVGGGELQSPTSPK